MDSKKTTWVPMHTGLSRYLPASRPFSEVEAMFSLQLNHFRGNEVSVIGFVKAWGWTRKRVRLFLKRVGVVIEYPVNTSEKRNQRGKIRGHTWGHIRGHIMFIDFNMLDTERAISGAIPGATIKTSKYINNKDNISSSETAEGSEPYRLSELLFSLIRKQAPKFKEPDFTKWAVHLERAIRIDGRTPEDLEKVIRWSQADNFWRSNILSTAKLREKFDQLTVKMNSNNGGKTDDFTSKEYRDVGLETAEWLHT